MKGDLLDVLGKLFGFLEKGQKVRNEVIQAVNDLSSAILMASVYTSSRFNNAISAEDKAQKIQILTAIDKDEIEAHARMNGLCAPIAQASNEILHFCSELNLNRNIDKKSTEELKEIINVLARGEGGLQALMSEYISLPLDFAGKNESEINDWLRKKVVELASLSQEAIKCQEIISKVI